VDVAIKKPWPRPHLADKSHAQLLAKAMQVLAEVCRGDGKKLTEFSEPKSLFLYVGLGIGFKFQG